MRKYEFAAAIPGSSGIYALILASAEVGRITVGRLGEFELQDGFYTYVGSAFGPGGLKARIGHHCRLSTKPHWHIDYLRAHAQIVEVWYALDDRQREHHWADVLAKCPGTEIPSRGFGSSDCTCLSHLFFASEAPHSIDFRHRLLSRFPGHAPIYRNAREVHFTPG